MKDYKGLMKSLKRLKVETGSLACFGCGKEHSCGIRGCAILREAAVAIEELVTKCNGLNGGWISVKERVPDLNKLKSDWVIGVVYGRAGNTTYDGAIEMVGYEDGHWWLNSEPGAEVRVTHWMPLPEGPGE